MNGLFAWILGIDPAEERERAREADTKTNAVLEEQYLLVARNRVDERAKEYRQKGETEAQFLPKLYRYFGIPMRKDVKDVFARDVIIGTESLYSLAKLITRRQMSRLGYKSVMYEGVSSWQKSKRVLDDYDDTKTKYPWLYGDR